LITVCLTIYLIGVVATTTGALQAGGRPSPNAVAAAAFAGLIWPLLLVGVAEIGAFAALARRMRHSDSDVRSFG
jgi:ABC-type dipeptide/oligopeptide/nickel transport system permease component